MRISIGKILRAHGVKGDLKVLPLTDFPERYSSLRSVIVENTGGSQLREVEKSQWLGQYAIIKFVGIDDRDAAEKLRGSHLKIEPENLFPLAPGQYYIHQLLGITVVLHDGTELGQLAEIMQTGSNDVYKVTNSSDQEFLLPAIRDVIRSIDLEKRIMTVKLLPGLLETQK